MKDDNQVVVIGSGPGGSAASVFLAQAGVKVLLLEAGAERSELGLTLRLNGMTVAKHRRPLKQRTIWICSSSTVSRSKWSSAASGSQCSKI